MWRLHEVGSPRAISSHRLLSADAREGAQGEYQRELDPSEPKFLALSNGSLLMWYDEDSAYLYVPSSNRVDLVFHPADRLRVWEMGTRDWLL